MQAVDTMLEASEGDMRKAITTLQSAARLKGKDGVTKADVVEVAGVIVLLMLKCFCQDPCLCEFYVHALWGTTFYFSGIKFCEFRIAFHQILLLTVANYCQFCGI